MNQYFYYVSTKYRKYQQNVTNVIVLFLVFNCEMFINVKYFISFIKKIFIHISNICLLFLQDLQNFPRVQMKIKLQRRDEDVEKPPSLHIRLEKISSRKNRSRAYAPRFPKVKFSAPFLTTKLL